MTSLARRFVPRSTADEIELEILLALDAVKRGRATNAQANKVIICVGAAQIMWARKIDQEKHRQAVQAWRLLCQCSLLDELAPLTLTQEAYLAICVTLREYLRRLTKFTIGEVRSADEMARLTIAG